MNYTLEEIKEHREEWVEALRSGRYAQGRGALRVSLVERDEHERIKNFDVLEMGHPNYDKEVCSTHNFYCCLGVAMDIIPDALWETASAEGHDNTDWFDYDHHLLVPIHVKVLHECQTETFHLTKEAVEYYGMNDDSMDQLVRMNDTDKASFEDIANFIVRDESWLREWEEEWRRI